MKDRREKGYKKAPLYAIMFLNKKTLRKRGNIIMQQTVLNFKLKYSEKEKITPYAGLVIYGELYKGVGLDKIVGKYFPEPGSARGFEANTYIYPLILMLLGGGKYIADIEKIDADEGLKKICKIEEVPSPDAYEDWIKRDEQKKEYIRQINNVCSLRVLKRAKQEGFTLDIDASGIEAEKRQALYTYLGYKGYMPMLGFIAELDWCIGYEFREGNVAPATRNYEFTKEQVELVKKSGKKILRFRSDSAAYQYELINYLEKEGIKYTITVSKDESVKESIKQIQETEWKELKDKKGRPTGRKYAEFIHSMEKTEKAFRIIVQRWANPKNDLFGEESEHCYHAVATNYLEEEKTARQVIRWHNGRGNSENYNKEVKIGFNMEYMPSGDFDGNAVWFGIGILAYNLFIMSKLYLFPNSWLKKKIGTIRWQFIQMAGKILDGSRYLVLRICSTLRSIFDIYEQARRRCWELQLEFQSLE